MALLEDDVDTAEAVFETVDSPRGKWGISLCGILKGKIEKYPTYFEIRNFFEIDLDFFIKNEKIEYAEYLLGSMDVLVSVNQEIYKYAARIMYENKIYSAAEKYFELAKKTMYKDAELHFMIAKYNYCITKDYKAAYASVNECLKLISDYYPAKMLKLETEHHLYD